MIQAKALNQRKPWRKRRVLCVVLAFQVATVLAYLVIENHPSLFKRFTAFWDTHSPNQASDNQSSTTVAGPVISSPQMGTLTTDTENFNRTNSSTPSHVMSLGSHTNVRVTTNDSRPLSLFQPIYDKEAWLYSAFFDHVSAEQGRPLIRMFGVAQDSLIAPVVCSFNQGDRNYNSSGPTTRFPFWHGVKYPPIYVECGIPKDARPTHVSVTFNSSTPATNRLLIQYPGPRTRNFTVCYSVFHNNYDSATLLIENIEMNRILGADHFYVYNYSISPRVDKILRQYQQEGVVTIVEWPIPTLKSWYFAQNTALNDCFYRNRNVSRFVVVVDTDELLIPKNQLTWMELIHTLHPEEKDVKALMNPTANKTGDKVTGCFGVRSSYFATNAKTNWTSFLSQYNFTAEETSNLTKYSSLTLTQFWRKVEIFPFWVRSKYIARPELVYEAGVHYVQSFIKNKKLSCVPVSEKMALVHHYRVRFRNSTSVLETGILKYKTLLYPRLMKRFHAFSL